MATNLGNIAVVPRGVWNSTVSYLKNSLVGNSGNMYLAMRDVPAGTSLSNTTYWMVSATKGVDGDVTAAAMNTAISTVEDELQAQIDIAYSGIVAHTSRIVNLENSVGSLDTSIDSLGSTVSSISTSLSNLISAFLNKTYPVGSIYLSVSSTSPATLFGGTWVRIQDRFLLAAGSTYSAGATGGEASHILTINEMPSHNHYFHNEKVGGTGTTQWVWASGGGENTTAITNVGGGQAHNNMPPYLSVYMWKRTA